MLHKQCVTKGCAAARLRPLLTPSTLAVLQTRVLSGDIKTRRRQKCSCRFASPIYAARVKYGPRQCKK
jgi:hypothetical protein